MRKRRIAALLLSVAAVFPASLLGAASASAATPAAIDGPPPPDCGLRTCITDWARYEHDNTAHNREAGPQNCNFYSGYWGNSGDDICGWINGSRWRSNEWCADFARYVWRQGGANVSGLDPWAGSFYRANKDNGSYHSKGSGYIPAPGDAVIYDWDGSSPSLGTNGWDIDHVGIVESYASGTLTAIEGNTSGGASREGVFRQSRDTSRVVGYVSPRSA
jgi:hypothetical protein